MDGWFVSNEYPTFDCADDCILAEFLLAYFKAGHVWAAVAAGSKGLGSRRQRVQPDQILAHKLFLPPLPWQRKVKGVMARADQLRVEYDRMAADLDALMPAALDRVFRGEL